MSFLKPFLYVNQVYIYVYNFVSGWRNVKFLMADNELLLFICLTLFLSFLKYNFNEYTIRNWWLYLYFDFYYFLTFTISLHYFLTWIFSDKKFLVILKLFSSILFLFNCLIIMSSVRLFPCILKVMLFSFFFFIFLDFC